jgi:hypothetical protein
MVRSVEPEGERGPIMSALISSIYRAYCYARLLEMRRNRRRLGAANALPMAGTSQPRARNNECQSPAMRLAGAYSGLRRDLGALADLGNRGAAAARSLLNRAI